VSLLERYLAELYLHQDVWVPSPPTSGPPAATRAALSDRRLTRGAVGRRPAVGKNMQKHPKLGNHATWMYSIRWNRSRCLVRVSHPRLLAGEAVKVVFPKSFPPYRCHTTEISLMR